MTKDEFKTKYKNIYEAYTTKLIDCHKNSLKDITNPMPYFVNYLKFMRDFYLLTTPEDDNSEETNVKISSIMAAVEAYDKYKACAEFLKQPDQTAKEEELKKLQESKQQLLDNFWKLVAVNMEDWLPYDA